MPVPVIDIFAGPGGLGEGFAAFAPNRGENPFKITLSIEKDPTAHRTLRLRSFYRQFASRDLPETYYRYIRGEIELDELKSDAPKAWAAAEDEAWCVELGSRKFPPQLIDGRIRDALGRNTRSWVLIGGPPCQAYSLVGRSKNRGLDGYQASRDKRHELYRAYLRIVARHWPAVFVMENVKGLLSSRVGRRRIFDQVRQDLEDPGSVFASHDGIRHTYRLHPVVACEPTLRAGDANPSDYIVRCEDYGIPQARHRIIILGVRDDIPLSPVPLVSTRDIRRSPIDLVIGDLPSIRSGISGGSDSPAAWLAVLKQSLRQAWTQDHGDPKIAEALKHYRFVADRLLAPRHDRGGRFLSVQSSVDARYANWFLDARIEGILNHEARSHMIPDLHRYLYAACFAKVHGRSPSLAEFPRELLPAHRNVGRALSGSNFADRFRAQPWGRPSTTITSHIAKDGHYYIHPDPLQCRSLTVREAARLQTFPDNYFFEGGRTSQYHQIGNAVPPLLAHQLASVVFGLLRRARKLR